MILLDMEMPKSCADCVARDDRFCGITGCYVEYERNIELRSIYCPIKAEIPKNATNGDVIKAMFPRGKTWIENHPEMQLDVMRFDADDSETLECFNLKWWSAPWKGSYADRID